MSFVVHLMNRFRAPGSVANYFSSVKIWFTKLTGSPGVFDSYHVKLLKKGVSKALQHEVSRAIPMSPRELTKIVKSLSNFGVEGCLHSGPLARLLDISKSE